MDSQEEELVRLLTDATNRAIVAALDDGARELTLDELAERIVSEGGAIPRASASEDRLERTKLSLHHEHLPRLEEAGLLEYDCDENLVTRGAHSTVDAEWSAITAVDELLSRFRTGNGIDESAVGVLEGRENVSDYCRAVADEAEDELFLIYATDELLDEDCLPHAKNAIERGVEFRAGAKSPDAREFFRTSLPEATVWEPQLDWMYDRSNPPAISRLVVADRETVAVGLWDRETDEGKSEIAMIGDGETNPLVVLVRELLGSRLDHLDYQSDDFLDELPFEP